MSNQVHVEFEYYTTPSHGYLKVPIDYVEFLEYVPTAFSKKGDEFWYLEEDVDAPAIVELLKQYCVPVFLAHQADFVLSKWLHS